MNVYGYRADLITDALVPLLRERQGQNCFVRCGVNETQIDRELSGYWMVFRKHWESSTGAAVDGDVRYEVFKNANRQGF